MIFRWMVKSILHRRLTAFLLFVLFALSVGTLSFLGKLSSSVRQSFEQTISGTDLIVGSRACSLEILLASVFHRGGPLRGMSYESYKEISTWEEVEWATPISLGDSHRGFSVIGTEADFFENYRYAGRRNLEFVKGQGFGEGLEVVLGSEVARSLSYGLGDQILLSHGHDEVSFQDHSDHPFKVTGILAPTGTPVDRSVLVSLQSLEEIHDGQGEEPAWVTAVFVKLVSPLHVFRVRQTIERDIGEALSAILPGIALRDLWSTVHLVERAFEAFSWIILFVTMLSLVLAMVAVSNDRCREVALWRAQGAGGRFLMTFLTLEGVMIAFWGSVFGVVLVQLIDWFVQPLLQAQLGITAGLGAPGMREFYLVVGASVGAGLFSLWPALWTYRKGLAFGLRPGAY